MSSMLFKITSAYVSCPFYPTIYVGLTECGHTVYARYRSGVLSIRIDPRTPAPHRGAWGLILSEVQYGGPDDGVMTYEELRTRSADLLSWPEELIPSPSNTD